MKVMPDFITTSDEPKMANAMCSPENANCLVAISEEFDTLAKNGTWKFKSLPLLGTRIIPSGIILKLKRDSVGHPALFKARMVARGNLQENYVDYLQLYASVACIELVRLVLAI